MTGIIIVTLSAVSAILGIVDRHKAEGSGRAVWFGLTRRGMLLIVLAVCLMVAGVVKEAESKIAAQKAGDQYRALVAQVEKLNADLKARQRSEQDSRVVAALAEISSRLSGLVSGTRPAGDGEPARAHPQLQADQPVGSHAEAQPTPVGTTEVAASTPAAGLGRDAGFGGKRTADGIDSGIGTGSATPPPPPTPSSESKTHEVPPTDSRPVGTIVGTIQVRLTRSAKLPPACTRESVCNGELSTDAFGHKYVVEFVGLYPDGNDVVAFVDDQQVPVVRPTGFATLSVAMPLFDRSKHKHTAHVEVSQAGKKIGSGFWSAELGE